jgi:hypothetical protein
MMFLFRVRISLPYLVKFFLCTGYMYIIYNITTRSVISLTNIFITEAYQKWAYAITSFVKCFPHCINKGFITWIEPSYLNAIFVSVFFLALLLIFPPLTESFSCKW